MKKIFNDNLWWIVIIAVALAGFALYKTMNKKEVTETVSVSASETAAE